MSLQYSSLLNTSGLTKTLSLTKTLGLLSAGLLMAGSAIAQTKPTQPHANIAQTAPTVPAAPSVPTAPVAPVVPPTVPTVPGMPGAPVIAPAAPPTEPKAAEPKTEAAKDTKTIVDIASSNGSFKTLTAALEAAGLTEALAGQGPFTVFAPTDAAFEALPKGTVETLLKPENKAKLVKVLTYHVVPGNVLAADLKTGKIKSIEGSEIKVTVNPKGAMVNNAKVALTDVKASNGVIHAIDKVILPTETKTTGKTYPKSESGKTKPMPKAPEKAPKQTP
jgi:uncharacterized surface protein with fasciclin (FAS1) repeats